MRVIVAFGSRRSEVKRTIIIQSLNGHAAGSRKQRPCLGLKAFSFDPYTEVDLMSPDELGLVARHIMKLLVERRYDELEPVTGGVRLTSGEMEEAVDDIAGPLVMPPDKVWHNLDVVAIRNWPGAYSVTVDLWTAKGRSDHTVEFTVHSKNGRPVIELDDIHVR